MTFGENEYLLSFWEETAKFFLPGGGVQWIFSYNLLYKDIYTPETLRFSTWEERAKYFLLRVQLSFSFYLLYMDVYTPD